MLERPEVHQQGGIALDQRQRPKPRVGVLRVRVVGRLGQAQRLVGQGVLELVRQRHPVERSDGAVLGDAHHQLAGLGHVVASDLLVEQLPLHLLEVEVVGHGPQGREQPLLRCERLTVDVLLEQHVEPLGELGVVHEVDLHLVLPVELPELGHLLGDHLDQRVGVVRQRAGRTAEQAVEHPTLRGHAGRARHPARQQVAEGAVAAEQPLQQLVHITGVVGGGCLLVGRPSELVELGLQTLDLRLEIVGTGLHSGRALPLHDEGRRGGYEGEEGHAGNGHEGAHRHAAEPTVARWAAVAASGREGQVSREPPESTDPGLSMLSGP
jgi:hypothetical protein